MTDCLFCKIVNDEVKASLVYRDEQVTAFRDIHPVAPTHILIIPNKHIESVNQLQVEDEPLIGHMFMVGRQIAAQENIHQGGYRIVLNTARSAAAADRDERARFEQDLAGYGLAVDGVLPVDAVPAQLRRRVAKRR